jgi:hypothetical protein
MYNIHFSFFRGKPCDIPAFDGDGSTSHWDETDDGLQGDCFAGPRRPHENKKFMLSDCQFDIAQMELAEIDVYVMNPYHISFLLRSVRMRKTRKSIKQIETSHTATGWEYFNP